ncbi:MULTISPECIES: ParB N-terminal domain-containing protein [unclassified Fusibacter]|uniref:ParB N-terminal domain-containing protein n=1 Tax=unclassified Fusibacter TaxID=2624464 RepID=UPI00101174FD|nr:MULTISPECIES: ParB N-terminal domain-containing protein [unclassified Fusibacter]MCK8058660.1 ParB N-terminal domain-containing protein [Fusibacter sp. A2]NPE21735.1 ParB N-terminal domain-containing protein [Fusibacter sp. A1]RXV61309.1 hypothetical protein DWB64_07810 [Fusibacter sp. A1]
MNTQEKSTYTFSISEAIKYAQNDLIETWLTNFLSGIGNNPGLASGLRIEPRNYLGPVLVDLKTFNRCCGPEPEMKHHEPTGNFEARVKSIEQAIVSGYEMPPLLVNLEKGALELTDGNHRYESLLRAGYTHYWTIFWETRRAEKPKAFEDLITVHPAFNDLEALKATQNEHSTFIKRLR